MTSTRVRVRAARWPDDAEALQKIRATVFIEEQGVPRDVEWDGQDEHCLHVIAEDNGQSLGCGRLMSDGRIGRLAVSRALRGTGIGADLLRALLDLARDRGDPQVYLHAQAHSIGFYEKAGFTTRGEPFDEAGIQHQDMVQTLDYTQWNRPIARAPYPQTVSQLATAQASLAQRELRILSPSLDPRCFDTEEFRSAALAFIRRHPRSSIRIMVREARPLVQRGHRLIDLARRAPSSVHLRCLGEHPDWPGDHLVLRDRAALLYLSGDDVRHGSYRTDDPGRCENERLRFEELWKAGVEHPEFRALSL
ncbi:MAG: GNAT family N-acetyltransferase [Pseudomonadota bacterium]